MIKIFHQAAYLPLFRHTSDCWWQKKIFENFYLMNLFPLNCAVDAQNGDVPPIWRNFFLRHQILHITGINICKIGDGLFWFRKDNWIFNFQNRILAIFVILLPISHQKNYGIDTQPSHNIHGVPSDKTWHPDGEFGQNRAKGTQKTWKFWPIEPGSSC